MIWAVLYAGLVVFAFYLSTPQHWSVLVAGGRIAASYAEYIAGLPSWVVAVTCAAALTRLLGAVSLTLLREWALPVYMVSFALVGVIMYRGFVVAGVAKVIRPSQILLELAFLLLSGFAVLYSWYQSNSGILK